MKKTIIRTISLTLIFALCLAFVAGAAEARASYYIKRTSAAATASGNGKITVIHSITGTGIMTEIGATKIEIKNASGSTLKTYKCTDPGYESMMGSNTGNHNGSVTYSGISGATYYAVVYFKAANSTGGDTNIITTYTVIA